MRTLTVLTAVFVTLKLTGVVTWPWFWVLFPALLPWVLLLLLISVRIWFRR